MWTMNELAFRASSKTRHWLTLVASGKTRTPALARDLSGGVGVEPMRCQAGGIALAKGFAPA